MRDHQAHASDLLQLQPPCPVKTSHVEQLATCMYSGGMMELSSELMLPLLQLGDAIQVWQSQACACPCAWTLGSNMLT